MRKYIDADKAIKDYAHYGIKHFYDATDLEAILNECPAADVVEVRHGKWEPYLKEGLIVKCSVCGSRYIEPWNYCPNCGSRMDLEGDIE